MHYVYFVVINHPTAPSEPILTDMFTSERAAHEAFQISYHKVAPENRPNYHVGNAMLHNEGAHL
jgi:hypothetical protein